MNRTKYERLSDRDRELWDRACKMRIWQYREVGELAEEAESEECARALGQLAFDYQTLCKETL